MDSMTKFFGVIFTHQDDEGNADQDDEVKFEHDDSAECFRYVRRVFKIHSRGQHRARIYDKENKRVLQYFRVDVNPGV